MQFPKKILRLSLVVGFFVSIVTITSTATTNRLNQNPLLSSDGKFVAARQAFPTHKFCLSDNNFEDTSAPTLATEAITNKAELEVCIFRVAQEMMSVGRFKALLSQIGFEGIQQSAHPGNIMRHYLENGTGIYMSFSFSFVDGLENYDGSRFQLLMTIGIGASIVFDETQMPVHIRTYHIGRFRN